MGGLLVAAVRLEPGPIGVPEVDQVDRPSRVAGSDACQRPVGGPPQEVVAETSLFGAGSANR
jgi:hypothetical protein